MYEYSRKELLIRIEELKKEREISERETRELRRKGLVFF